MERSVPNMDKPCYLCKSSENDELLYGKILNKHKLSVHYYCLLLSSNLVQNGANDTVGILGFLPADIRKENERTKSCRCYICKQMHANVFCCAKKCLRTFHTVCGIKNRCLSHYTGTFQSWCAPHVPLKDESRQHPPEEQCSICYEEMGRYDKITSIRAPCCKNGWFHQLCVARVAQTAGYFFKCPLCNNVDTFTQEMSLRGVFVPEQDAAWETEPNAFQDQLVRPSACDAKECKCAAGRETDNRQWKLLICGSCGSTCRHRECMESAETRTYVCNICRPIVGENIPKLAGDDDNTDDDDEEDGDEATSFMSSVDGKRIDGKVPSIGSEESGVQCSSSDESVLKPHHVQRKRILIQSVESDSEQSDSSASVIRRNLMRNTGKWVRRVISEESEETDDQNATTEGVEKEPSDDPPGRSSIGEQVDENSDTSGTSSISVERAHTIHRADNPAKRRWVDSSDDCEDGTNGRQQLRSDRSVSASRKKLKRSSPSPTKPVGKQSSNGANEGTDCTGRRTRNRTTVRWQKSQQSSASLTTSQNSLSNESGKKASSQTKRNRSKRKRNTPQSRPKASKVKDIECTDQSKAGEEKLPNATALGKTPHPYDSDSSDDIPLSKHQFMKAERCSNQRETVARVDAMNRSNEENIRPQDPQANKALVNQLTPPQASTAAGRDRNSSSDKLTGQGRLQQSILTFFSQTPRYTPSKATSNSTESPASSSTYSSTKDSDENGARRAAPTAGNSNPNSSKEKQQKIAIPKSSDEAAAKVDGSSSKKARRRSRKSIETKDKGQINLLNYFNRC